MPRYRLCWISEERLDRNCWARELGQLEMALAEDESRVGMRERKEWKMLVGE